MLTLAVVIPAYNERRTIAAVAAGARRHAPQVIVVDDGSTDGTADALAGLAVRVLRHADNRGKAASLWAGMQAALAGGAEAVVTLDADGQHDPADVPRLAALAAAHPDRLIIAARARGRHAVPPLRRFANAMADFWISWAAGCKIIDTQSGFRLYPAPLLRRVRAGHDRRHGFVFESEVLIEAARLGFRPLPVAIAAVYAPDRRASYYRPAADTLKIIAMVARKLIGRGLSPVDLLRGLGVLTPAQRRAESRPDTQHPD